ncbi:hypothetical protein D9M72_172930 [compost metagenome]
MTDTLNTPTNRDEADQVAYGDSVIKQLLGATICAFGATHTGEIFLVTRKGDERQEFIIGKDADTGEIAIFEVEEGAPA